MDEGESEEKISTLVSVFQVYCAFRPVMFGEAGHSDVNTDTSDSESPGLHD